MNKFQYALIVILQFFYTVTPAPIIPDRVWPSNPEEMGRHYQGDMILDTPASGRGVGIRPTNIHRWPNGVVPYVFASNMSSNYTPLIVRKLRDIENATAVNGVPCITFREKNASDATYILIINGTGCNSAVGSGAGRTGPRTLSLMHSSMGTCMVGGVIQHEFLHALGFFHEQSRPDRDTYINIRWSNIDPSFAFAFDKYNETQVDTLMTPYDYGSVMQYGATAFALNTSVPTIIPTFNTSANLGQRVGLSPIDILEVQRFYGCVATPTTTTTTTITTATTTTAVAQTTASSVPSFYPFSQNAILKSLIAIVLIQ